MTSTDPCQRLLEITVRRLRTEGRELRELGSPRRLLALVPSEYSGRRLRSEDGQGRRRKVWLTGSRCGGEGPGSNGYPTYCGGWISIPVPRARDHGADISGVEKALDHRCGVDVQTRLRSPSRYNRR